MSFRVRPQTMGFYIKYMPQSNRSMETTYQQPLIIDNVH